MGDAMYDLSIGTYAADRIKLPEGRIMSWEPPSGRGRVLNQLQGLAGSGVAALGRFAAAARSLLRSRTETRRVLSEDVYRVPDAWLDDVVRVRLEDLDEDASGESPRTPPEKGV